MFAAKHIAYDQTNAFTRIVIDYLNGSKELRPFYAEPPTLRGIEETILRKQQQSVNRKLLVETLQEQYRGLPTDEAVKKNIGLLLSEKTFTVCTAHQPNLFTGPLYFIYKILHTIRLAAFLKEQLPQYDFVPVYYMGSEDADFAELNHTWVGGKKLEWKKEQRGAVGRMLVDKTLLRLIDELEGQLAAEGHGPDLIRLLRTSYAEGKNIQTATLELVNQLYGTYGLIVLIPDHAALKSQMKTVFAEDLFQNTSSEIVHRTSDKLGAVYSVQAHPREINLFYLKDDIRERIVKKGDSFIVHNTSIRFTDSEIRDELERHPERFSPNVILRGLYQETILPNLVFVGGGGEMAYWLQLKDLFAHYNVVYPVLLLRNSFLVLEKKWKGKLERLGLSVTECFLKESEIMKLIVAKHSQHAVFLNGNFEKAEELFEQIRSQAGAIDPSLSQHVAAIKARSLKTLQELEKKMLRAEKRKFSDQQRQVEHLKAVLFPGNGLQERVENFSGFYAKWGERFIEELYQNSLALEQQFTILCQID
jgi:bacillithiol biosynthesis cysteine-adding enzyme BshC